MVDKLFFGIANQAVAKPDLSPKWLQNNLLGYIK